MLCNSRGLEYDCPDAELVNSNDIRGSVSTGGTGTGGLFALLPILKADFNFLNEPLKPLLDVLARTGDEGLNDVGYLICQYLFKNAVNALAKSPTGFILAGLVVESNAVFITCKT